MLSKNWSIAILTTIGSALAICFDYVKVLLKHDAGSTFNFMPGILFIIAANLVFAGLFVLIINRMKSTKSSLLLIIFLLALGLILILVPLADIRPLNFILPYFTMQVNYTNVAGSLWIIIGLSTIIRRSSILQYP